MNHKVQRQIYKSKLQKTWIRNLRLINQIKDTSYTKLQQLQHKSQQ